MCSHLLELLRAALDKYLGEMGSVRNKRPSDTATTVHRLPSASNQSLSSAYGSPSFRQHQPSEARNRPSNPSLLLDALRNGVFPGQAALVSPLDFAARFCRISYLCRKDSHESCSRYYYFLREGPVTRRALSTTLGARAEAWGPRSDVRTAGGLMNI